MTAETNDRFSTSLFDTKAVHAGQAPDETTGAVIPPVHFSTTYAQDGIGGLRAGYEYGRSGNPTRTALETQLAEIEGGARALSFASGLAARTRYCAACSSRATRCCSATTSTAAPTA
jgi:cystathionine gamma-synthase